MEKVIKAAVERGASDLHIKAGDVFRARIDGKLVPLTKQRLTPDQTKAIALRLIPVEEDRRRIDSISDYDCSWGAPGVGRFRVNVLRQRSSFMIVMRVIPFEVPTFEGLGMPPVLAEIAESERGLVLVTGMTGSGRTSTMAALVNHVNKHLNKHIVTLENPIEYLHRDLNSSVTQREIGSDTGSFSIGLRAALRQDPDVILIGELSDVEALDTALQAAENGHLVISALHAPDATTTVSRMAAMFAPEEQEIARMRIADAVCAVIAQRLIPLASGEGRRACVEILRGTPGIRERIRDRSRVAELKECMERHRASHGMQSFEQHLLDLVTEGVISGETARAAAGDPEALGLRLEEVEAHLSGSGTGGLAREGA